MNEPSRQQSGWFFPCLLGRRLRRPACHPHRQGSLDRPAILRLGEVRRPTLVVSGALEHARLGRMCAWPADEGGQLLERDGIEPQKFRSWARHTEVACEQCSLPF